MKTCTLLLAFGLASIAAAQTAPAPSEKIEETFAQLVALRGQGDPDLLAAKPGEPVILEKFAGLRLIASADQLKDPGFPAAGIDAVRVPWIDPISIGSLAPKFLGKPASQASLTRLVAALRVYASVLGHSFVNVYLPPQDITGGYVQIVIAEAKTETGIAVVGARHFSERSYLAAIRQQPGQPIDKAQLDEDVAWLNRNPYRQVRVAAGAGATAGTTQLDLQVQERLPWSVSAAYDNTGSKSTDEDRVSASVTWANALGRGDQATYRFLADPNVRHSKTHSFNYNAFLPWRHTATVFGSYSTIESIMAAPFTQQGTSWQAGARYDLPLRPLREGVSQSFALSADFKYSDNTLEFATIPITDNVTHVAQLGATYGVSFRALGGHNSASLSGYASPGGLTRYNETSAFAGSRPGAKADYVYGKLSLSHQRQLGRGFTWVTSADAQAASGALLGSEQLNGGGTYAVRGYRESSAFGDWGVVVNNELHAPGFALFKGNDNLDLFAFADLASLNLRVDHESTDLRSLGLGLNYQWRRHLILRASYGWQLKYLDHSTDKARAHVSASLSW